MAVKVIITRAMPGGAKTAETVAGLGLVPILAPMLQLRAQDIPMPDMAGYAGILFTSANGVRFFMERARGGTEQTLRAFCVGPATLAAARAAGFARCEHADGTSKELAELVRAKSTLQEGRLIHVANAAAAGTLAQSLRADGFEIDFLPLYAADATSEPSLDAIQALVASEPAIVLIHSAKGATSFKRLYALPAQTQNVLVAVSENAAAPLANHGFARTHISERPNETALMTCLTQASTTL